MYDILGPDINFVPSRNVYPTDPGGTLGSASAAVSPDGVIANGVGASAMGNSNIVAAVDSPSKATMVGHPVTWWVGLVVLFIALVWVARRTGNAEEFRNIKVSAYNILYITIAAIVGITGLKILFTKFPVPGLTQVIIAA